MLINCTNLHVLAAVGICIGVHREEKPVWFNELIG